jgi:cytochrome c biogenesis protein CcdA
VAEPENRVDRPASQGQPTDEVVVGSEPGGGAVAERTQPGRRTKTRNLRPYAVIAGLVLGFSFFTLAGSLLINALGLPADVLRIAGLVVIVVIGLGLIFPRLEAILEKPFSRIPQRAPNQEGGAFALGLGLGLLYVPCAGPILAAWPAQPVRHGPAHRRRIRGSDGFAPHP